MWLNQCLEMPVLTSTCSRTGEMHCHLRTCKSHSHQSYQNLYIVKYLSKYIQAEIYLHHFTVYINAQIQYNNNTIR